MTSHIQEEGSKFSTELPGYGATENDDDLESEPLVDKAKNVYESASRWSQLTFGWLSPILSVGKAKNQLDIEDITSLPLPMADTTAHVMKEFREHWKKEISAENRDPQVLRAIWKTVYKDYCYAGLLKLVHDLLQFVGPQVLHGLISFLRNPDAPMWHGLLLTASVTFAQLVMSICLRHYFFQCYRVGLRVRTIVITQIYQKALVLSSSNYQHRRGEITNLMSVDSQRLQETTTYLHSIWFSLVQIILAMFFLWREMGISILAGVLVILISIPLTTKTSSMMGRLQRSLMKVKDNRIEVNNEILGNMKIVKLQAWEKPFSEKVNSLRQTELSKLFRYMLGKILSILIWSTVPLAISVATFGTYVLLGNELDVAEALTALALFEILRFPLFMLPNTINNIVEAIVALGRVDKFLKSIEHKRISPGSLADIGVELAQASFVYENKRATFAASDSNDGNTVPLSDAEWEMRLLKAQLEDAEEQLLQLEGRKSDTPQRSNSKGNLLSLSRIDVNIKKGEFIAVVGGVGSGKTTLLKAILGEVRQLCGDLQAKGKISYSAQSTFIMNATVKDNILFGKPENANPGLYEKTIDVCALKHDFELLPYGDQTEIGEKGITLSGGQKARISMARALYHNPDIFLLDDPLAAVDALVGRKLFNDCIVDSMLLSRGIDTPDGTENKRTVILVTNALQYLSHPLVDRIIILKEGKVIESGTFNELNSNKSSQFKTFLDSFNETRTSDDGKSDDDDKENDAVSDKIDDENLLKTQTSLRRKSSTRSSINESLRGNQMNNEMRNRETGKVSTKVYVAWAKAAGGVWVMALFVLGFAINEAVQFSPKWWLTYWSKHGTSTNQMHFLDIYALISAAAMVTTLLCSLTVITFSLRASKDMFSRLLKAVMKAPMSFFDTTPLGQIINRFSKGALPNFHSMLSILFLTPCAPLDIYTLDEALPDSMRSYFFTMAKCFSTVIVISAVTPIFALSLVPILFLYRFAQKYFSVTYRELKRLDSIQRSPIYALFGETLDGVSTIRAFEAEANLMKRMVKMLDNQQHAYFLTSASLCWLAVRLEVMGTVIVLFACLFVVLEHDSQSENESFAGLAGLAVAYALSVTQSLNWTVRVGSDFEANMVSVERLEQYVNIRSEAPSDTEFDEMIESWPAKGALDFQDVELRYRPGLPRVLKQLNLSIPGNSKVGVVGRTGAGKLIYCLIFCSILPVSQTTINWKLGKSTLLTALMRIVEVDKGKILIDGVDISLLGLRKLRSTIAVIPQDPVLFSGTIKQNLDPFDEYPADRIESVLARVGLMNEEEDNSSITSLEDAVLEGGENFSVGQRQLLVIGRALLSEVSVVICDEATAAVDAETDKHIQKIFRSDFDNATCLTVAHRLNTIMDSDYILVMEDGKAAEFDTPKNLLKEHGGKFKELVDAWEEEHAN